MNNMSFSLNKARKSTASLLVVAAVTIALMMSVGYATLSQSVSNVDTSNISTLNIFEKNAEIVGVGITKVEGAAEATTPIYTKNTVEFNSEIIFPDDRVVYNVRIKNNGTKDVRIDEIILADSPKGSEAIIYTTSVEKEVLKPGESTKMEVIAAYDPNYTGILTDTKKESKLTLNFVEEN